MKKKQTLKLAIILISLLLTSLSAQLVTSDGPAAEWYTEKEVVRYTDCTDSDFSVVALGGSTSTILPNNTILIFFVADAAGEYSESDIYYMYTEDYGDTWSTPLVWIQGDSYWDNDCWIQTPTFLWNGTRLWTCWCVHDPDDRDEGKLYVSYCDGDYLNKSAWSAEMCIDDSVSQNPRQWYPTAEACISTNNGFMTDSGRMIFPGYWYNEDAGQQLEAVIYYTNSSGETWQEWETVELPPSTGTYSAEPAMVLTENGSIFCSARWAAGQDINYCWSEDGGMTWGDWSPMLGYNVASTSSYIQRVTSVSDGEDKNRIAFCFNNDSNKYRHHLTIAISTDECRTFWNYTRLIGEEIREQYPTIITLPNKSLFLTFGKYIGDETVPSNQRIYQAKMNLEWISHGNDWYEPQTTDIQFISIDGESNGTNIYDSTPTFNWTRVTNASEYHLEISTSSTFSSLVANVTHINEYTYPSNFEQNSTRVSFTLPNDNQLIEYNTYYCRVRALTR